MTYNVAFSSPCWLVRNMYIYVHYKELFTMWSISILMYFLNVDMSVFQFNYFAMVLTRCI